MNGYGNSEEGVLLGNLQPELKKAGDSVTSAGTFALRRANYFNETIKPQLTEELQLELIKSFREGNADAKRKMVAHNMQLVITVVKRYSNRGVTLLDLILHGNHGLAHALEKFELNGNVSFPVFAEQCIQQYIERAVLENSSAPSRAASKTGVLHNAAAHMHVISS